jgi:hypothetical protein
MLNHKLHTQCSNSSLRRRTPSLPLSTKHTNRRNSYTMASVASQLTEFFTSASGIAPFAEHAADLQAAASGKRVSLQAGGTAVAAGESGRAAVACGVGWSYRPWTRAV